MRQSRWPRIDMLNVSHYVLCFNLIYSIKYEMENDWRDWDLESRVGFLSMFSFFAREISGELNYLGNKNYDGRLVDGVR